MPASEGIAQPERPLWLLTGLLDGALPLAVFDASSDGGGPPHIGTVGDEVGGYIIAAIREDTVILRSGNTEWTFIVEAPWR